MVEALKYAVIAKNRVYVSRIVLDIICIYLFAEAGKFSSLDGPEESKGYLRYYPALFISKVNSRITW